MAVVLRGLGFEDIPSLPLNGAVLPQRTMLCNLEVLLNLQLLLKEQLADVARISFILYTNSVYFWIRSLYSCLSNLLTVLL